MCIEPGNNANTNRININDCVQFTTKDTSLIREIIAPRNSDVRLQSLAEAVVPAGARTLAHYHPVTEEIYYILSGKGKMALEADIFEVVPGDAIGILPGQRHQIENSGPEPLTFLCCCVPAYEHQDTIECDTLL